MTETATPDNDQRRKIVFLAQSGASYKEIGSVLGLSSMAVSILFILPIPAAFFGAWFAGRQNKRFSTLMWQAVISCLLAGLMMWIPGWFGVGTGLAAGGVVWSETLADRAGRLR